MIKITITLTIGDAINDRGALPIAIEGDCKGEFEGSSCNPLVTDLMTAVTFATSDWMTKHLGATVNNAIFTDAAAH